MINVTNIQVYNLENAIIGMRNPLNSWNKIDSTFNPDGSVILGINDLTLMQKLIHAGSPHDKFMRQIFCSMQIEAPLFWWKEMDTYKVATTANSTSTMHKLHSKPIELSDFGFDDIEVDDLDVKAIRKSRIEHLEYLRKRYLETKDQIPQDNPYWRMLIQDLPDSYLQKRMWTGDYATLREFIKWRKYHKLIEWRTLCDIIENKFPYGKELIAYELD